jgi:Glycosyl hydrolase family 76
MARRLYSSSRHLFGRRRCLLRRDYETLWPFADAWSAICTWASLEQQPLAESVLPTLFSGLAAYHRSRVRALDAEGPVGFESVVVPPLGTGGDVFFDDNAWLGLALLRHYELTQDHRALTLSRRLFQLVTTGWSSDGSWGSPGGIRWKEPASSVSRNTCSNGPAAELGALVHQRTGDPDAFEWSVRIYDWVRSALLGPQGLYFDRIAPDGTLTTDVWSYNQGTMIGAGVLLHGLSGDRDYLAQAIATATASLNRFSVPALVAQNAAFNAVFFRNLFLLDRVVPNPAYRQLAHAYAAEMWRAHRDPRTGLFRGGESPLNDSAPLVEIYSMLAGAPAHA